MRSKVLAASGAAVVLVLVGATSASAINEPFTWDGDGGDADFSTGGNWVGGVAPLAANIGVFDFPTGLTANQDGGAGFDAQSLAFTSPTGFTLTGTGLDLFAGLTTTTPTTLNLTGHLNAVGDQTWVVGSAGPLTVDGDIRIFDENATLTLNSVGNTIFNAQVDGDEVGPAHARLVKTGDGAVTFAGDNGGLQEAVLNAGTIHSEGLTAQLDVLIDGGGSILSGGAVGNLGEQQVGLITATEGIVSPGPTPGGPDLGDLQASSFVGSAGGVYRVDVTPANADLITVSGVFDADGTVLNLALDGAPAVGSDWVIVDAAGGPVDGSLFSSGGVAVGDGVPFAQDGSLWRVDYNTVEIVLTYLGDAPASTTPTALPPTGVDASIVTLAALLLLLGGAALAIFTRRGRTE